MRLTFCGAAKQVTGSCFLFQSGSSQVLVDCGLFQGNRTAREQNMRPFPFDPKMLDAVILTHAHLDHSGLLPKLHAEGFRGPLYMTAATRDLIAVLLPDSAYLQQMEAERARRYGRDFTPLYDTAQVSETLKQGQSVAYDKIFEPARGFRARLRDAGHILGSAIVELWITEGGRTRKVVCSGDLGQPGRPIVRDPTPINEADILLMECTYGNRDHKPLPATLDELVESLKNALTRKRGVVLVPAFAVGRTQEFLYFLNQLSREGRIPAPTVFVDSPLATEVTQITARHFELFDEEARRFVQEAPRRDNALRVHYTESVQDSMSLNRLEGGAIIVAGSGMCDGGRIRHHLKHHLPDPNTTVLIIGFQAAGTLGRRLVDRAPEVRIFGEDVPVRAQIVTLGGFSAHADQSALTAWLRHFKSQPDEIFLVHGEEEAATAFASHISRTLKWRARVPNEGDIVSL